MSVKNVRIDWGDGYDVGESVDGKTMEGFGTRHFIKSGDKYEGYFKNDKPNGFGKCLRFLHKIY